MKLKSVEKFKLENVLYVTQVVKSLLRISRLVAKGSDVAGTR